MKRHLVLRYLKLWNIGFCLVSGFEIIAFIILSFFIPISVNSQDYTILSLFFTSGLATFHMPILWIILFTSITLLIIFAIIILITANNENIQNIVYARILISGGFFLLITNFIKVECIYVLSKSIIDPSGTSLFFELMLYNPANTPFLGAALWIYFTASACVYFISGLVFAAIRLKWMQLLENKKLN